jgi:hypothetical protein
MFCPRLFLENDVFFTDEDIQPGATTFSENILFLRSLYNQYSIHYILNQCIFHARIALSDNTISTEKTAK